MSGLLGGSHVNWILELWSLTGLKGTSNESNAQVDIFTNLKWITTWSIVPEDCYFSRRRDFAEFWGYVHHHRGEFQAVHWIFDTGPTTRLSVSYPGPNGTSWLMRDTCIGDMSLLGHFFGQMSFLWAFQGWWQNVHSSVEKNDFQEGAQRELNSWLTLCRHYIRWQLAQFKFLRSSSQ